MAEANKRFVNAYMNSNLSLFWDPDMKHPITQTLYKRNDDPRLYIDEALSIGLNTIFAETGPLSVPPEEAEEECSSSNTPVETGQDRRSNSCLLVNQSFTREQTLYLIHLMRNYLTENNGNLPKSLNELTEKVRQRRGNRSIFWQEVAKKLLDQFQELFDPKKVARKWETLLEGYKKVKDNNSATRKGKIKFQYYGEIDELIGNHHDVDFPVIGTSRGVVIARPSALVRVPSPAQTTVSEDETSPPTAATSITPSRKRKGHDVVAFLKEAEERSMKRHQEYMEEIKASRESCERLMQAFLDKL